MFDPERQHELARGSGVIVCRGRTPIGTLGASGFDDGGGPWARSRSARCAGTSTPTGRGLLAAGIRADDLGYDTLWTWDHLYPIVGASDGPNYEGWLTITAWAQATSSVTHRPDGRRQHVPRTRR